MRSTKVHCRLKVGEKPLTVKIWDSVQKLLDWRRERRFLKRITYSIWKINLSSINLVPKYAKAHPNSRRFLEALHVRMKAENKVSHKPLNYILVMLFYIACCMQRRKLKMNIITMTHLCMTVNESSNGLF